MKKEIEKRDKAFTRGGERKGVHGSYLLYSIILKTDYNLISFSIYKLDSQDSLTH